jgi:RNA polymerase sigma-54 factor
MGLGPRLELRQSQQLVMTPQMQQAIQLLTLTNVELETFIAEALEKNPLLTTETGEESPATQPEAPLPAPSEGDGLDLLLGREPQAALAEAPLDIAAPESDGLDGTALTSTQESGLSLTGDYRSEGSGEGPDLDRLSNEDVSLHAHLLAQAGMAFSGPALRIAQHLIDLIDESGYLTAPIEEVSTRLSEPPELVIEVLAGVQRFDPVGVAARSLSECIALQAREADRLDPAMQALIDNLPLVARGDIPGLMRVTACDREDVMDMIRELRSYDPKPGLRYGGEPANPVVADVFVRRVGIGAGGGWRVELNQATLPRLIIDRDYHAELARDGSKATTSFLNECLAEANWLVKALDQRARTIVRVTTALVEQQRGFFENGVSAMKPLTLRAIADIIEVHESTVSRVAANKYLACEQGLYELRWFFSSGVASSDGDGASANAVKDRIARLIANEGDAILSDEDLAKRLQTEGFDIARRTVLKYRVAMGLGSGVERRRARALSAA